MPSSDNVPIGARVEVLHPDYVAGKVGIVRSREELADGQPSDRWIIEVSGEDVVLSLSRSDFRVLS